MLRGGAERKNAYPPSPREKTHLFQSETRHLFARGRKKRASLSLSLSLSLFLSLSFSMASAEARVRGEKKGKTPMCSRRARHGPQLGDRNARGRWTGTAVPRRDPSERPHRRDRRQSGMGETRERETVSVELTRRGRRASRPAARRGSPSCARRPSSFSHEREGLSFGRPRRRRPLFSHHPMF